MPKHGSIVYLGPRSPFAESVLENAAGIGHRPAAVTGDEADLSVLEAGSLGDTCVVDPGLHPVDAGGKSHAAFDFIDRALPILKDRVRVVLLSSCHVFAGDHSLSSAQATRAPQSDYGRRLVALEDRVLARGEHGLVLRLGRVLSAADPLVLRWWNGLKEGVAVHPPAQGRCAPLGVESAVRALMALLDVAGPATYQVSAPDEVTYLEIAQQLSEAMKLRGNRVVASAIDPSAMDLESWPSHVSMQTTPDLLVRPPASSNAVLQAVIRTLSA